METVFPGAALTLLTATWSCCLPAQAGGLPQPLLPEWPAPATSPAPLPPPPSPTTLSVVPPGSVRWGMPFQSIIPRTRCPRRRGRPWKLVGRDSALIHAMASYTNQLDGCVQVMYHNDPYDNITNGKFHVYGEGMYWALQMLDRVQYLYPHAMEPLCFMIRRADFEKREIFAAFVMEVYILICLYLVIFILILRFGFKVDVIQAITEATETFLTGGFVESRRPLMIWGSVFSLIILNSFSGVFTSFLTVPKRGMEVDTLEELTQHYDHISISPELRQAFLSHVDTSDHPKLFALFDSNKPIEELRYYRYPSLESETNYMFIRAVWEKINELRLIKECMWSSAFVSFPVAKNWTLADRYSMLLMRLVQAGVVTKARADEWRDLSLYLKPHIAAKPSEGPSKLSLDHFVEAFIILCAGAVAGLVCFLGEVVPSLWRKFTASLTL